MEIQQSIYAQLNHFFGDIETLLNCNYQKHVSPDGMDLLIQKIAHGHTPVFSFTFDNRVKQVITFRVKPEFCSIEPLSFQTPALSVEVYNDFGEPDLTKQQELSVCLHNWLDNFISEKDGEY